MAPGLYVAFGICVVFFIAAIAAMLWAFRNGEFEDIEGSKFDMMYDNEEEAAKRKAAFEQSRTRA